MPQAMSNESNELVTVAGTWALVGRAVTGDVQQPAHALILTCDTVKVAVEKLCPLPFPHPRPDNYGRDNNAFGTYDMSQARVS